MSGTVTYVRPYGKSVTYHGEPDDPFEPMKVDREDYGKAFDRKLDEIQSCFNELLKIANDAEGRIEVLIDTGGPHDHGYMGIEGVAAMMVAMAHDFSPRMWDSDKEGKVVFRFRTRYEALHSLFNLMTCIIDNMPSSQLPSFWKSFLMWNSGGVSFWHPEGTYNFKTTVLALRLMGDEGWYKLRDKDVFGDKDFGTMVVSPSSEDEAMELTQYTGGDCIMCGNPPSKAKYMVQLNDYAHICDECVERCHQIVIDRRAAE